MSSAIEQPTPSKAQPHGHGLVERLLPSVAAKAKAGYVVEVGSTRENLPGQGSTIVLASLATRLGLPFITVDMDPINTERARADLAELPDARAVTAKGEDFLATFDEPVVAAYLDAFDIQHGKHSPYRVERYRLILGVEITDAGASAMHLACAKALIPRMVPGGLIVIDDTWEAGDGYAGKGQEAVPALLAAGFTVAGRTDTAIALRRPRASQRPLPVRLLRRSARIARRGGQQIGRKVRGLGSAMRAPQA